MDSEADKIIDLYDRYAHDYVIDCGPLIGREEPSADTAQRPDERGHSRPTMWAHYAQRVWCLIVSS